LIITTRKKVFPSRNQVGWLLPQVVGGGASSIDKSLCDTVKNNSKRKKKASRFPTNVTNPGCLQQHSAKQLMNEGVIEKTEANGQSSSSFA
jgi:hypothetical protein